MVDRDRLLEKLDELDRYLGELRTLVPKRFEDYEQLEKKRACERTVQLCIETVIDTCALLVTGLRLGLPGDPADLFERLARGGAITPALAHTLTEMKGLRNILVHEYGRVDDRRVFRTLQEDLGDFDAFRREIGAFLRTLDR